jgi:hypothetical protein
MEGQWEHKYQQEESGSHDASSIHVKMDGDHRCFVVAILIGPAAGL